MKTRRCSLRKVNFFGFSWAIFFREQIHVNIRNLIILKRIFLKSFFIQSGLWILFGLLFHNVGLNYNADKIWSTFLPERSQQFQSYFPSKATSQAHKVLTSRFWTSATPNHSMTFIKLYIHVNHANEFAYRMVISHFCNCACLRIALSYQRFSLIFGMSFCFSGIQSHRNVFPFICVHTNTRNRIKSLA